jgi:hypothetical protein
VPSVGRTPTRAWRSRRDLSTSVFFLRVFFSVCMIDVRFYYQRLSNKYNKLRSYAFIDDDDDVCVGG